MNEFRLDIVPGPETTELRLFRGAVAVPVDGWALTGHPAAEAAERWRLSDEADGEGDLLLVANAAIARLSAGEAARLGLPPATALHVTLEPRGIVFRPGFQLALRWTRPTGQLAPGVQRTGAWLREPEGWRRLPDTLFAVAEAADAHTAAAARADEQARLSAVRILLDALPMARDEVTTRGILGTISIVEADALSLDAEGEGDALRIVPVLHRAGTDARLLDGAQHIEFAHQFAGHVSARAVYALRGATYVTVAPPLRRALEVVRRVAAMPPASRRAFLRAPRPTIAAAIGAEADVALVERLVLETPEWSDRVIGLGLWQKRVLPWIAMVSNDWFDGGGAGRPPRPGGLLVDDQRVPLSPDQAEALAARIKTAVSRGEPSVPLETGQGTVQVPATVEILDHLSSLHRARSAAPEQPAPFVLLIKPNETAADIEAPVQARAAPPLGEPETLLTMLKPHQRDGLRWLQDSFVAGAPGVLLADDMGLGKTLQGLAFLAWLRAGMQAGTIGPAPLLIVAPTGLLANWRAEHDRHLAMPGLGTLLPAYGAGLAALRQQGADGLPALDVDRLRAADWILTTYETLRDHDRDFGKVRFAALLLDEAQKVKTPGIRLTDAAKGMHADFRIAMTGTPVENRLADLWCIVDGVAPGHLQSLRWFSAEYEADSSPEKLEGLKSSLDRPIGGRPPLLKRRLRSDHLPDLPTGEIVVQPVEMRGAQLAAYEATIAAVKENAAAGGVLAALQRLRTVSLHPDPETEQGDAALIEGSVRLRTALDILDRISADGERALLFVERQAMMARLVPLLQRRYRLALPPMTISGEVPGAKRQLRVDAFQAGDGFEVMLLSPKAGGVGLTLTRANHVIHLERWWNPAVEDQCNGRALRIGQTRQVRIYLPLAILPGSRPSFDLNLHRLLERKRRLMQAALIPPEATDADKAELLRDSLV